MWLPFSPPPQQLCYFAKRESCWRHERRKKITTLPFFFLLFFCGLARSYRDYDISDITWRQQQHATPPEPPWRRGARQPVAYSSYCTKPPSVMILSGSEQKTERHWGGIRWRILTYGSLALSGRCSRKKIYQKLAGFMRSEVWSDHPAGLVSRSEYNQSIYAFGFASKWG